MQQITIKYTICVYMYLYVICVTVSVRIHSEKQSHSVICGIKDGCFYSGASIKNLGGNNYSFYYRLLNYLELNKITSFSEYFLYISFESSDNLSPEYTLSDYEAIDLTLMFGEGNEPSKEWCDKNLTNYYEYNIEGTLVPIKEIGEPVRTSYYDVINLF